jgi:hypothetical protein
MFENTQPETDTSTNTVRQHILQCLRDSETEENDLVSKNKMSESSETRFDQAILSDT